MKSVLSLALSLVVIFSVPALACQDGFSQFCVLGACWCTPNIPIDLPGCPDHNCGPSDPPFRHEVFSIQAQFPSLGDAPPKKIQKKGILEVCFWEDLPGKKAKMKPKCTAVRVYPADDEPAAAK